MAECLAYLKSEKKVGVKQVDNKDAGFKKIPMTVPRFRPQFRPDGSLLTLKRSTNKLQIIEVKVVKDSTNKQQKKVYHELTEVLKKHTTFSEVS